VDIAGQLLQAGEALCSSLAGLKFGPPVTHVYNPLGYAWRTYAEYVGRYGNSRKRVLFLGMNPGPFGMAQTGVAFGEIAAVRDWMGLSISVDRPAGEHPKRPVVGAACKRSEVSGKRLWGWAAKQYGTAEAFFRECFVVNYCPLIFLEESGRNRTPDKVPAAEMAPVETACLRHLGQVIAALQPEWCVGVGGFAEAKFAEVLAGPEHASCRLARIPHPSPANPAANRNWEGATDAALAAAGVFA
jgi:single-strand selective monofunctional uracil DNA glycosylase